MNKRTVARAIGVDTGGTFTDFVAAIGDELVALKLPSTPRAPERAVLAGLARLASARGTRVRHGSTVATNTLLERKGARVAFLTTEGFEDLLEIGRQDRPDIYSLAPRRVPPLVPAERRIGVRERRGPSGQAWVAMDAATVRAAVRAVRDAKPEAIAVGLLHSYAAPENERALGRALARLGVPVTLSSELCPEVREYERFSTTVANAYLAPRMSHYLEALARGSRGTIEVMLSHGGTAPPAIAAREPVRQLLSGPAAGLTAALEVARAAGYERALTLDVGGTSTDCAYLEGRAPRRRAREVAGLPIQVPMLDVQTVGAGGGSIARVDAGGLLHVGPESAGARPGPACYGNGGPSTVTDAMMTLGRIPHERLAGGRLKLDREAARRAMSAIARRLGSRDGAAAAEGVARVAEARMAAALRNVSVERGHDPRGAAIVAFGGAGGLHACALAEALDCRVVLFPRHAGLLCAIGALQGASRRERSRTVLLDARDTAAIGRAFAELERAVRDAFPVSERGRVQIERWAEVRCRGQSHELSIRCDPLEVAAREGTRRGGERPGVATELAAGRGMAREPALAARFHREHRRRFGFSTPDLGVEVVTVEVRGAIRADALPKASAWWRGEGSPRAGEALPERAPVFHDGAWKASAVRSRAALAEGDVLRGPAIVAEEGATLWIPPRWTARVHGSGALVVTR
jgi:N-methylhydantoinase A